MPKCQHCGAESGDEATTCPACGQPFGRTSHNTILGLDEAGIVCPHCDSYNDASQRTCAGCGRPLVPTTQMPAVETSALVPESLPVEPEPPAKNAGAASLRFAADPDSGIAEPTGDISFVPPPQVVDTSIQTPPPKALFPFRLRLLRGHGNINSAFEVGERGTSIGRSEADINLVDDPCLASVHARLRPWGEHLVLEDQGGLNGTFLRMRGPTRIQPGTEFIVGSQRIILLGLGGPIRDSRARQSSDGTNHFGGPRYEKTITAFRLVHQGKDGRPWLGNVFLHAKERITVGRGGCDMNFPQDRLMSGHCLTMLPDKQDLGLVETDASNGIFLRVQKACILQIGDEILVGQEVFRVELV